MTPRPHHLVAVALLTVASAAAQLPSEPQGMPVPLDETVPALTLLSSWAQDTRYEGEHPDVRRRGAYPIGNGRVFTYLGLGARANTLLALTGPRYQTDETFAPHGHFGTLTCDLLRDGAVVDLPRQRVRRVRGAGFVATEDAAPDGLALRTLTFAAPDARHLTRVVEIHNGGDAAVRGLRLRIAPEGPVTATNGALVARYVSERRPALAFFAMPGSEVVDGTLRLDPGELAPGARWRRVLTVSTVAGSEPPAEWSPVVHDVAAATAEAEATARWWRTKLADTSTVDTDHRRLRDLVEDWKVILLAQRCAESGAVAPMINHRGAFVRDTGGALLLFLRFKMWDEARALLRYQFDAARLLGRIVPQVPLDLDVSAAAERQTDWAALEVPDAELPSWVILQHLWYWRATQDHALVREHWPMLDACLKKQRRAEDNVMPFGGDEPWMQGALYRLYPDTIGAGSGLIAEAPDAGRRCSSFASAALFMVAVHAFADMLDGLDRVARPEAWAAGAPEPRPGTAFIRRGLELRADVERHYWLEGLGFFAPALSPVTGEPHRSPVANANLLPLWAGWTWATGEKTRSNVRNTLARLWRSGARVGTTPTVGHATADLQGMLLFAESSLDGARRFEVFDELLRTAGPAGEWGRVIDPDGHPVGIDDPHHPGRCRPWESGVNVDALLHAVSGVRFNAAPNWDDDDIRLKLRMPPGATWLTMKNVAKDGRELHVFARDVSTPLDEQERADNARQPPSAQLPPDARPRRLRFRIEQISENPPRGYWHIATDVLGTQYPRTIWKGHFIEGAELWKSDTQVYLPADAPPLAVPAAPVAVADGCDLLVLSARRTGGDISRGPGTTIVDVGLPRPAEVIAAALIDGTGRPRHRTLLLDHGWDDPGTATLRPTPLRDQPPWRAAIEAFEAAGGTVARARYLDRWTVAGAPRAGVPLGLAPGQRAVATLHAEVAREVVLRLGAGRGMTVTLNGEEVLARSGRRRALPDADAVLVQLRQGDNELAIETEAGGEAGTGVWARVTDTRGLPVSGVSLR